MRDKQINDSTLLPFCICFAIFVAAYTIAPLHSVKISTLGPFSFASGDLIFALTFVCTDIVNEVYGRQYARKIVIGGLFAILVVFLFSEIVRAIPGADIWKKEQAYNEFFGSGARIYIATIVAYLSAQITDIYVFSWIRNKTEGKYLYLRNNISTFIARFMDSITFFTIAYYGVYETPDLIHLIFSGYVFGLLIALLDTPLVYLGSYAIRRYYPELKFSD